MQVKSENNSNEIAVNCEAVSMDNHIYSWLNQTIARTPIELESIEESNRRVILNVGGTRNEILRSTLVRLPQSRLGQLVVCKTLDSIMELCDEYSPIGKEYFFDRHPQSIGAILNFYRTGKLHFSDDMCVLAFSDDLEYWGIADWHLETCCRNKYYLRRDQVADEIQKEVDDLRDRDDDKFGNGNYAQFQKTIWDTLEKPGTNLMAKVG